MQKMNFQTQELQCAEIAVEEAAVREKYRQLTLLLIRNHRTVTTMESCTSGQIASLITDTEGSSAIFRGAFITYSNEAKIRQGVPAEVIEQYGVYSAETAAFMAQVCRNAFHADIGIGVTGSFGNADPENRDSIPGEVFFAVSMNDDTACYHCSVPVQPSRSDYKYYMADLVVDVLLPLSDHFRSSDK